MFTIMLVEDDEWVRESTAELMRELGHSVHEAGSAEQALALLQECPVDVLVTDIGLPGMSGDVFAAEARALRPNLRLVFATANPRIPDVRDGDGNGPVMLRKPFDLDDIARALNQATR